MSAESEKIIEEGRAKLQALIDRANREAEVESERILRAARWDAFKFALWIIVCTAAWASLCLYTRRMGL